MNVGEVVGAAADGAETGVGLEVVEGPELAVGEGE